MEGCLVALFEIVVRLFLFSIYLVFQCLILWTIVVCRFVWSFILFPIDVCQHGFTTADLRLRRRSQSIIDEQWTQFQDTVQNRPWMLIPSMMTVCSILLLVFVISFVSCDHPPEKQPNLEHVQAQESP